MPIHDLSYRRFTGERTGRSSRVGALGRSGVEQLLKRRLFLGLIALSWTPALVRGVQIYLAHQFPQTRDWLTLGPGLWKSFLTQQVTPLVLLVALFAGAGIIANDLRTGAVLLYLAKPISRFDYVLGRGLPVAASVLGVTWAPATALLVFEASLAGRTSILVQEPWIAASVFGYSTAVAVHFTVGVLAVSSLTRSARLAAAGFVLAALGSHVAWGAWSRLDRHAAPSISFVGSIQHLADLFFGSSSRYGGSPWTSLATLAALWVGGLYLLDRRLRRAEVVS
jgi:ABC-2 type transport system permease protein